MSVPARFWPRYAAWSLDAALAAVVLTPFLGRAMARDARALEQQFIDLLTGFYGSIERCMTAGASPVDIAALLTDTSLRRAIDTLEASLLQAACLPLLAFAALMLVLHVAGGRSPWQGSPGKRALDLRVIDRDGARPGFARSVWREVAGLASWLTLNLGHAMAAIGPEHLALHDRLSRTRVVRTSAQPLPAWARGWILVQAAAAALLTVVFTGHLASLAQAAVERVLG